MRSKSIIVSIVIILLTSCATPSPEPTITVAPSSTHTAAPTLTETPEPTLTPTAPAIDEQGEDIQASLDKFYFEQDYLAEFATIKESTLTIAGEEVGAIVGVDGAGAETVLTAEMTQHDGTREMVRVSGYTDATGRTNYVFLNPELGVAPTGAFQLTERGAELLWGRFYEELSQGQFAGMTPEQVRDKLWTAAEAGTMTELLIPTAFDNLTDANRRLTEWESVPFNPTLPMEVVMVGSWQQFEALPEEWQRELPNTTPNDGMLYAGLVTTAADGHLVVIGVDTNMSEGLLGFNRERIENALRRFGLTINGERRNYGSYFGDLMLVSINWLSEAGEDDAFNSRVSKNHGAGIVDGFPEAWWEAQAVGGSN